VPSHVALLRGINVGGRNRVAMADLRDVVESCGHTDGTTYIASGNVVFTARGEDDPATLAAELERAIAARLPVRPAVVVLSRAELADVVAANPYPDETDPRHLHAVFHAAPLDAAGVAAVAAAERAAREKGSRDEATVVGRVVYLRTPDGLGRSELAVQLGRGGRTDGTARNWATVTKLLELCAG
jgi:uncharacterized protein (DUF1697 family)